MEYLNRKGKYFYNPIHSGSFKKVLEKLSEEDNTLDVVCDVPLKVDKDCMQLMSKIQTISFRCLDSKNVFKSDEDIVDIFEKEMEKNETLANVLNRLKLVSKIKKKDFFREIAETSLDHKQRASPDFLYMAMNEYISTIHHHQQNKCKKTPIECAVMDESCVYPNLLNCFKNNNILVPGDTVAVITPIESDFINLLTMPEFGLNIIAIPIENVEGHQIKPENILMLKQENIRALFLSNPVSSSGEVLSKTTVDLIATTIKKENPYIPVIMDCSYIELADDIHHFDKIKQNIIGIHTMSKLHGDRGLNVSCVFIHTNNIIDKYILPNQMPQVHARYSLVVPNKTSKVSFYDRLRMDTRHLYNTLSTLSCQQQLKTALTCIVQILDKSNDIVNNMKSDLILNKEKLLCPLEYTDNIARSNHTIMVDIIRIANNLAGGTDFGDYLQYHRDPQEFSVYLAHLNNIISLPGVLFFDKLWSIKINLGEGTPEDYCYIGNAIRELIEDYYYEYKKISDKIAKIHHKKVLQAYQEGRIETDIISNDIKQEMILKSVKNVKSLDPFKTFIVDQVVKDDQVDQDEIELDFDDAQIDIDMFNDMIDINQGRFDNVTGDYVVDLDNSRQYPPVVPQTPQTPQTPPPTVSPISPEVQRTTPTVSPVSRTEEQSQEQNPGFPYNLLNYMGGGASPLIKDNCSCKCCK